MAYSDTSDCATSAIFSVNRLDYTVDELGGSTNELQSSTVMTVYLAYAEDSVRQHYLTLAVSEGTTILGALEQAGWLHDFVELAVWCQQMREVSVPIAKGWRVGIYAQKQPLHYQLQPFDRVEIYRSLSADPMSQRKSKSRT